MNSPQKRGTEAPSLSGSSSAPKITPSKAGEFPPIRSRSPKKDAHVATTKRRRDDASKTTGLPRVGSKVSYEKNGDHLPQVLESGEELEVLKCILVREGYLQRLAHASAQGRVSGSQLSETIDVLDLLRIATIDVVEAIVNWRIKQLRHAHSPHSDTPVFTWNSINYLLKLSSDLDFLDKHQGLIQWLGFTLVRNPFILPVNLNTRSQLDHLTTEPLRASPGRAGRDEASSQFVQVGGKRTAIDPGQDATSALRAAKAAALAERKRAKNPYETRVINDEELVPISRFIGTRTSSAASDRPSSRAAAHTVEMPSQIGEIDMARIHACEKIVLQEEAQHGRYTRDVQGQLVPESEAIRRRNMSELSGDAYAHCRDERELTGDVSPDPTEPNSFTNGHRGQQDPGNPLPPHAHAKKRAGMLGPISNPQQRKPSRKPPADRSRGAHLEEVLRQERRATLELGILIDRVREEIERKEMDLAYFESFPGVQMFGTELEDFRRKTYAEVALLRRDVAEKDYIYQSRTANLNRKEEIIHTFKENRKSVTEAERSNRLQNSKAAVAVGTAGGSTNQDAPPQPTDLTSSNEQQVDAPAQPDEARTDQQPSASTTPPPQALTRPIVHDMCATLIQKIARGKLARAAFEVLKIEYYVGSKYIQAVVRGFIARRRVAKMYWQLTASVILQRFARGMLARRLVARRRHARAMQRAALRIQCTTRGHFGRMRMKRVRRLFSGRKQLLSSMDELNLSDVKELADACFKMAAVPSLNRHLEQQPGRRPLPSIVLGLVRVVMVLTTDSDDDVSINSIRWKEAAHFLCCSSRLQRRVGKVAGIAATGDRYLRASLLGAALLDMYSKDQDFNERTFANLETGWRAAMVLYRWVKAYHAVCQEQGVLESKDAPKSMRPFLFAESTDAIEAMQERAEEEENTIQELALERRFVPRELVCSTKRRTRAMLLVVAFDVPHGARCSVIEKLCNALPGLFVVMNRRLPSTDEMDSEVQQQRRTARARKEQLDILGADYASIRESLEVGHSVILDCDVGLTDAQQRQFVGAFTALKASIKPSPMCLLLRGSLGNRPVHDVHDLNSSSPRSRTKHEGYTQRLMFDADIKHQFEQSAEWLHRLGQPDCTNEMVRVSSAEASASAVSLAFVLVMEAVVILLTPSKRYEGPQPHTSGVSWKLARRLLANPTFFVSKLASAKYDSISRDNLRALGAYLSHSDWPTTKVAHGSSGGALLHALAEWVRSVVTCSQMALDRHGLVPSISRSTPVSGLFDSVVIYNNTISQDGDIVASQELLDAALADARVYRKVHTLDARRCVISIFHDCQRLYFSAYDPMTSWRWQRIVPEEDIDMLLAPNSVERGEDAVVKRQPPASRDEMYDRLVKLCLLQPMTSLTSRADTKHSIKSGSPAAVETPMDPATQQLIVRPPAVRLFRRVLHLGGHRATVTLAELSRGRIQVDVTIHSLSLTLRRVVSLEQILKRLSHHESRNVFIPPDRLPAMVLERLHLYRRLPSSATLTPASQNVQSDAQAPSTLQLGVRTKELAPGRVVLRKAIRSRWLSSAGQPELWVLTVVEHHSTDQFRAEVYQPRSSERFSRFLSKREFQDLRLPELCQHPASVSSGLLLTTITKLLQFEKDPDEADASEASIVACALRHHILVRFPLAIRFVVSPHHAVERSGVVRTYVQVETKQPDASTQREDIRFRICFPDTCEEQALEWQDAQVDSVFATSAASWTTAVRAERKRLAYELARNALRWDPDKQKVVADLPCGSFEAFPCTRDTGVRKPSPRAFVPTRSKKSLFSARSSRGLLAVSTSCVRLLDSEGDENELSETEKQKRSRVLFVYDREELVHSGSYRANGVLVTVQVFMKAVIITNRKPRLPVDRLEQEDSFEIAFDFYHPATSTARRCVIRGRTHLREVVGPDKALLIASATVHELLEHIVESRTSVHFESVETKTHAESQKIVVAFVRDRLYAKHKVTPLPLTLHADAAANATKLIDAKPDRGLKLLTKTKTLADDSGGKVILTVFDVRHTRASQATDDDRDTHSHVQLRVDGYICDSSTRLSLSLEAADLVHIMDDEVADVLGTSNAPSVQDSDEVTRQKRRLAQIVIDHIGVERKRDGTPDRLFIVDTSTTTNASSAEHELKTRRLVGKTVRLVRQVPVVITVHAIGEIDCEGFEIQCYEPQTCARASLVVQLAAVGVDVHYMGTMTLYDTLTSSTASSLVAHILAHVHIDSATEDGARGQVFALTIRKHDDELESNKGHAQFQRLEERCSGPTEGFVVSNVWRGFVAAASAGRELCVVHLGLEQAQGAQGYDATDPVYISSARLVCSALALRKRIAVTQAIASDEISAWLSTRTMQAGELLRECAARLRVHVIAPVRDVEEDASDSHVIQNAWKLAIEMQK